MELHACMSSARDTSWFEDGTIAEFSVGPEWTDLNEEEVAGLIAETAPTEISANGWPWWAINGQVRVGEFEDGWKTYIALAWKDVT